MMGCNGCGLRWTDIETWIQDYDRIQTMAVKLIYAQIGCALIGSLGAFFNAVLLVNLGVSLFALVAIESSSQSLARTYAVLLFCSVFLDVFWFILFSRDIWRMPSETFGTFVTFSVKLTLTMQIIGFSVRLSSSLLWLQMYRLGVSYIDNSGLRDTEVDLRNSFLSPATPSVVRRPSGSDDAIGGSIYDPAYYSSLFEDGKDESYLCGCQLEGGLSARIWYEISISRIERAELNLVVNRSDQRSKLEQHRDCSRTAHMTKAELKENQRKGDKQIRKLMNYESA
ncbi:hypothetical protein F511_07759 [Dorcoceras hygrometricum]|uniref:Transmembrane protein n=1 Tax=Dorcoceras hygrometricum TaxID=472368 RepID=A0A2Z7CTT8_9LAMI|nr:hypothetical protein F511_07759 [Dorcoceras hygrometricum]